jgi:FkbM family methyltransferase
MGIGRFYQRVVKKLLNPTQSGAVGDSPLLRYVDRTALFSSEELLRLGTVYGGWIIPANSGLSADSVCYSAGAGEDISFDCALIERFYCQVRVIDPTPRAITHFDKLRETVIAGGRFPINNSNSDYYTITPADIEKLSLLPVGLADQDTELRFFFPKNPAHVSCSTVNLQKTEKYFTAQCQRLPSIMKQMGDSSIDLLKMDIEGGEYAVIKDLVTTNILPRILLVEFDEAHTPLDDNAGSRIMEHIGMLIHAGMNCITVEGSNATFVRSREMSR